MTGVLHSLIPFQYSVTPSKSGSLAPQTCNHRSSQQKKRMLSKALVIFTVALAVTSSVEGRRSRSENPQSRREGRFSIFNVVTFKHEQCTTSNGLLGTCLTSTECTSQGGNKLGNCASGFGVCCLKTISTCGSTVTNNCTYIQNPGYPSAYTGTTCQYSVKQVSSCL